MVRRWACTLAALGIAASGGTGAVPTIDIVAAEASWHSQFLLNGTKTEPTYIEHILLRRDGDVFVLEGGAPAGMAPSRESIMLRAGGTLTHLDCPAGMRCGGAAVPSGFLASATILAAIRGQELSGRFPLLPYGDFQLACIPAERLGIQDPVLDPCIDAQSGAVIAQRHRRSGEFDGPSLDAWSITLSTSPIQLTSSTQSSPM
jgi:hypothetical protein